MPAPVTLGEASSKVQQAFLDALREAGLKGASTRDLAQALEPFQEVLQAPESAGSTRQELERKWLQRAGKRITRALKALEEADAVIQVQLVGSVRRFVLVQGPDWEDHLSPEAHMALEVALHLMESSGSELWVRHLRELCERASATLSPRERRLLDTLENHVSVRGQTLRSHQPEPQVLGVVLDLLGREHPPVCNLAYQDVEGHDSIREIVPHSLIQDQFSGAAQLLAWDVQEQRPKGFRLNRIRSLEIREKGAVGVDRRRLETVRRYQIGGWHSAGDPYPVKVRVTGGWATHFRESTPHLPEVRVEPEGPNAILLHFMALEDNAPARFVLQLGADAEVLAPPSLRQKVAEVARRLMERHA